MKTFAMSVAGSLAAIALAGGAAAEDAAMTADEARAAVEAQNERFMEFFAADDAEGLASLYTEGGRLVPPDAPDMVGAEAITAYWTGALGVIDKVELVTDEAIPVGDGYITERAHVTLYGADGTAMGGGKAVLLWALEDGEWKMHWDAWNNGPVE
ncbi:MAG TPA: nuclear transport factor 2 family protein [Henriciella marina]|uniref:YybH family protein n=1 Tax=Henriciella sp. TaxID=1968823 RepID=UPI0017B339CF|nr:nuclear transport factor 2 family protein [Henriciella sp.]HIG22497.1 nuclear transport factor 2 family protein [Henriciella sp.]HIK65796.1 nuclear transport factor 2 family protein [Henriciella marina]